MTGLNATTTMAGVTGSVSGSDLLLNATSNTAVTGAPGSTAALASTGLTKIYATGVTPNVKMANGSIGGTAGVIFNGNPTTTITGTPSTTLTGVPLVTIGGVTGAIGGNTPINNMQPYLVLNYYIAVQGVYPSPN
jgi:microcystin-dependent protein